jgi:hypothetical protein
MSSFDDVLNQYEPPVVADIVRPGKVGEKNADQAGEKGGAGSSAPKDAASSGPADSHPAGTSQEPEPELPSGSDDEEKAAQAAAEEEAAAATAEAAATATREAEAEEEAAADASAAERADAEEAAAAEADAALSPASTGSESSSDGSLAVHRQGEHPVVPRKNGSLSFEGENAYLKQFPRILIDQMREILAPRLGDAFARDISQVSIVAAFVMAAMGTEIITDESTAHAVKAFRENDPKTDAIEKRTVALLEQQTKVEAVLKKLFVVVGEVSDTTAVLEMGQAYALAERTALLDTDGVLPETIDITQKRAVASRENIRKRVKRLRDEEKIRAGRPIR